MKKYVQVDAGQVVSPTSVTELPEEGLQYLGEFIDVSDLPTIPKMGWGYDDVTKMFISPDIEILKNEKKFLVDYAAGNKRKNINTSTYGQSETYSIKYAEAIRYLEAGFPNDLTDYPWISAEVAMGGDDAVTLANTIIGKHDEWEAAMMKIEMVRLEGKRKIAAAISEEDIEATALITYEAIDAIVI